MDARTGEERWRWDPLEGVGGFDQQGDFVAAGAGNAWATLTADADRDLLFVPTGSPSPTTTVDSGPVGTITPTHWSP